MANESVLKTIHPSDVKDLKFLIDSTRPNAVPEAYIQPLKYRPAKSDRASSTRHDTIPVVDLAKLKNGLRQDVISAIGSACEEWGFFQIINHGFSPLTGQRMLEATEKFFNLPVEDRMAYFSLDMTKPLRYGTSHNPTYDSALQWRDYMYLPCKLAEENVQTWPAVYRKEALDYVKEMNNLKEMLLELMSESLHLAPSTLRNVLGPDMLHNMVLNYYPACPQPDLTIGFREHSDKSTITILLQDGIGGLEVHHKDCWVPLQPLKDALLVNLGDVMEILSNGRYKSIAHRVTVNSNSKRLSIGSFYNVAYNAIIAPLPHCVDETHPLAFKEVMFMDFFKKFVSRDLDGKNALDYVRITSMEEPYSSK